MYIVQSSVGQFFLFGYLKFWSKHICVILYKDSFISVKCQVCNALELPTWLKYFEEWAKKKEKKIWNVSEKS